MICAEASKNSRRIDQGASSRAHKGRGILFCFADICPSPLRPTIRKAQNKSKALSISDYKLRGLYCGAHEDNDYLVMKVSCLCPRDGLASLDLDVTLVDSSSTALELAISA
jgi:hypothetical protein